MSTVEFADLRAQRSVRRAVSPVDAVSIALWCAAVQDGAPRHWETDESRLVAPPVMATAWTQAPPWTPTGSPVRAMELHHRLKEEAGLPTAVVREVAMAFGAPVRVGDLLTSTHRITEVGEERRSRLGVGRDWSVEVAHRNQREELVARETWSFHGYRPARADEVEALRSHRAGKPAPDALTPRRQLEPLTVEVDAGLIVRAAAASRDWTPFHHDPVAATRAGLPDIILNTPGHLALISRWATHNVAPGGRLLSLVLRLRRSVMPGDVLTVTGALTDETVVAPDGWRRLELDVIEKAGDAVTATGTATVVEARVDRDPWDIPLDLWQTIDDTTTDRD